MKRLLPFVGLGLVIGLVLLSPLSAPVPPQGTPDAIGAWSGVLTLPHVAIHSHVLPTGKVISWDRHIIPTSLVETIPWLWDPAADPGMTAVSHSADPMLELFCSSHVFLRDGSLFVAGGHNGSDGYGLISSFTYNAPLDIWTRMADMNAGRWYPTSTLLPNGDVCTVSGSITPGTNNTTPQVYNPLTNTWRNLTGAVRNLSLFPMMILAPNGKIFMPGPEAATLWLDTSGTGAWTAGPTRPSGAYRDYGCAVLYGDGKIFVAGGGTPTATAEVIDLNAATPTWRQLLQSMSYARRQMNALLMADGRILVSGGTSGGGFNNNPGAVLPAEIWDPDTETFTTVAAMAVPRLYHSTSVLLPDGRVLSQGGGHPAGEGGGGLDRYNAEIYSPPYLFKGPRPTITSAPSRVAWGQTFHVSTPQGASIGKVHLIRPSSVTHSTNMEQRICRPSFVAAGDGLDVTAPADPNRCPPGNYMLFILDAAGVPSMAKMIIIDTNTAPTAVGGANQTLESTAPAGTSVSLDGSGSTDPENNVATYQWYEGATLLATGAKPTLSLGFGVHTLRLRVTDDQGLFSETTLTVTITDATAPVIQTLLAAPAALRPSDGAMVPIAVSATVSDNADPAPVTKILSVSDADSGLPTPAADAQISGNLTVSLKRERFSVRRRYALLVECRDAQGNASTRTTVVEVRSKWLP